MGKDFTILNSIKFGAEQNIKARCEYQDVYDQQRFFISAIGIYDRLFIDTLHQADKEAIKPFYDRIIQYSYPVFIRFFIAQSLKPYRGLRLFHWTRSTGAYTQNSYILVALLAGCKA